MWHIESYLDPDEGFDSIHSQRIHIRTFHILYTTFGVEIPYLLFTAYNIRI